MQAKIKALVKLPFGKSKIVARDFQNIKVNFSGIEALLSTEDDQQLRLIFETPAEAQRFSAQLARNAVDLMQANGGDGIDGY